MYNFNDEFLIYGGRKVNGEITIQTSKNAALPILASTLLFNKPVMIKEVPDIVDVSNMLKLLENLKVKYKNENKDYIFDASQVDLANLDENLSKSMRSSIFLLGSMLSRFKKATIFMPGGCQIGKRPIDIHISSLKKLGVEVKEGNHIEFDATNAHSGVVELRFPSVGATENLIEFACLLKGKTIIKNPAKEPEIVDLCNFLNLAGAKILGAGTNKITIYGVEELHGVTYRPAGDRIVSATMMILTAIVGGNIKIRNGVPHQNAILIEKLRSIGCQIKINNGIIHMTSCGNLLPLNLIETGCYPEFATDNQSLILSLCCLLKGKTKICEHLFENRFLNLPELKKMGAKIEQIDNFTVLVHGVKCLKPSVVYAKDLRGGAGLVLACLSAKGESVVKHVHFIDRGYEHFEELLTAVGLKVERKCPKEVLS